MATKINLLPWRAERREQRKKEFFVILGGFVAAGFVAFLIWLFAIDGLIEHQDARNQKLQAAISVLDKQIVEIVALKKQRAEMLDRMKVIQGLQGTRPQIVHVFDELVRRLPDGVFFTKVTRKGGLISINGTAESNSKVSALMRSLSESEWFVDPTLAKVVANPAVGEQATDFNLTVDIATPKKQEEGKK